MITNDQVDQVIYAHLQTPKCQPEHTEAGTTHANCTSAAKKQKVHAIYMHCMRIDHERAGEPCAAPNEQRQRPSTKAVDLTTAGTAAASLVSALAAQAHATARPWAHDRATTPGDGSEPTHGTGARLQANSADKAGGPGATAAAETGDRGLAGEAAAGTCWWRAGKPTGLVAARSASGAMRRLATISNATAKHAAATRKDGKRGADHPPLRDSKSIVPIGR